MTILHEGTIGGYSFMMVDKTTIEVWSDTNNELPEAYIYVKEGTVKDKKSFDTEISYWYMRNVG
jgi:hypothetical protein